MGVLNSKEIDDFLWNHRDNGCEAIKDGLLEDGLLVNTAWRDKATGEEIKIKYACEHGKEMGDYCVDCGRIHNE